MLRRHHSHYEQESEIYGYGSIPIHTIFRGMNIHLPAILMFTRGTRFWHTAIWMEWTWILQACLCCFWIRISGLNWFSLSSSALLQRAGMPRPGCLQSLQPGLDLDGAFHANLQIKLQDKCTFRALSHSDQSLTRNTNISNITQKPWLTIGSIHFGVSNAGGIDMYQFLGSKLSNYAMLLTWAQGTVEVHHIWHQRRCHHCWQQVHCDLAVLFPKPFHVRLSNITYLQYAYPTYI